MIKCAIKELTDEWVEQFEQDVIAGKDLSKDVFWRLAIVCGLPNGVDENDPRVVVALAKIAESISTSKDREVGEK